MELKKIITVFVMIISLITVGLSGCTNQTNDNENINGNENGNGGINTPINNNTTNIVNETPVITNLITASFLEGNTALKSTSFYQNDTIYVYYNYKNVTINNKYNVIEEIIVSNNEIVKYNYKAFYNESSNENLFSNTCNFITSESWPVGQYLVTLKITNNITGNITTSQATFNLNEVPSTSTEDKVLEATITSDQTSVVKNANVYFTSSVVNSTGTVSYNWDFGDGNSSNLKNPYHYYSEIGSYFVYLTVTDLLSDYTTSYIQIQVFEEEVEITPLEAYILRDPETVISGNSITFYGIATGGSLDYISYEWDFNYDYSSFNPTDTGTILEYTFESSGWYTVKLIITDSLNNQAEKLIIINVT